MFQRILVKVKGSFFAIKLLWTLAIVFLYVFGRSLPIPTVALTDVARQGQADFLTNLAAITGGNFFQTTLFSLGLGPWMTSMILWRFLAVFNRFKHLTQKQTHYGQMTLMLLVAILQSAGMTNHLSMVDSPFSEFFLRVTTMVILISGTYILSWFANLNNAKGLGGAVVIILVNLILTSFKAAAVYMEQLELSLLGLIASLGLLFLIVSLLIVFTLVIYKAEYRIQIRRITIISDFAEATYIPIRLTPAGAMPYMYGMTLMILPPLVLAGLTLLFPQNAFLSYLATHLQLSQLPGVLIYMLLLFILSYGFAYYNYEPLEIAKSLRINSDYIEHIKPGKDTERYIRQKLNQMTFFGALITTLIGGLPLLIVLGNPDKVSVALLINNIYIITTMMLGVIEQLDVLQSWRQYKKMI